VLSPTNQANRNVAGENTCNGVKDEQVLFCKCLLHQAIMRLQGTFANSSPFHNHTAFRTKQKRGFTLFG
jgi:hypothetical protein